MTHRDYFTLNYDELRLGETITEARWRATYQAPPVRNRNTRGAGPTGAKKTARKRAGASKGSGGKPCADSVGQA